MGITINPIALSMLAALYIVIGPLLLYELAPSIQKIDLMLALWVSRRKDMQHAIDEEWPGNSLASFWAIYRRYSATQLEELLEADYERHKQIVRSQKRFAFHCELFWIAYD